MTDYAKLRLTLHRILSGRHEDGRALEPGDIRALCKVSLIFTPTGDGEEQYLTKYGLPVPGEIK